MPDKMEIHTRNNNNIQDRENIYGVKGKNALPVKRSGLCVRGALGDINGRVDQLQNIGKVAVAAAEFEKKATLNRAPPKTNYDHVQPKVNTGRQLKPIQARPPLRREESTAGHAAKAVARTRAALKETSKPLKVKDSTTSLIQLKKVTVEVKKTSFDKTTSSKEKSKQVLKDPTESLGKLKLGDYEKTKDSLNTSQSLELPDDIEDIDAADKNSPLLMSEYIKDIYKYLTDLELLYPIEDDHLKNQSVITGKMRATLMDWLVEVQRQFSLLLETFHLTVGIIDRYLQAVPNIQRNRLQLIGVTAMYIASKYEEIYAPSVEDFVYVTANAYTKADVFKCERAILAELGFCLARPIPLSFLRRFVKAAHGTSKHHHLAKYFVDLSLVEYTMAHYRPSELAAAALCLSLHLLPKNKEPVWTTTLSYYSGYDLDHIQPIVLKIARVVLNVENSKYQAVFKKYQDVTFAKVSGLPQLKNGTLQKLLEIHSSSSSEC